MAIDICTHQASFPKPTTSEVMADRSELVFGGIAAFAFQIYESKRFKGERILVVVMIMPNRIGCIDDTCTLWEESSVAKGDILHCFSLNAI